MNITIGDMAEALAQLRRESHLAWPDFSDREILERAIKNKNGRK